MSQFSQKYYKHFVNKKAEVVEEVEYYTWYSRINWLDLLFKLLVIALLLFCIFSNRSAYFGSNSTVSTPTLAQVPKNAPLEVSQVEVQLENETEQNSELTYKNLTLENKIPKHILPELSKIISQKEVTLEQYMYYANDTNQGYPSYIDKITNRVIKERKPKCAELECPVVGVSEQDKHNYAKWISELSQKEYVAKSSSIGFMIKPKGDEL